jgi:hypothetical protein
MEKAQYGYQKSSVWIARARGKRKSLNVKQEAGFRKMRSREQDG